MSRLGYEYVQSTVDCGCIFPDTPRVTAERLLKVLDVMRALFELATRIGFVGKTYIEDLTLTVDNAASLRADVLGVVLEICNRAGQFESELARPSVLACLASSVISPSHAVAWARAATQTIELYKVEIFNHLVKRLVSLAEAVSLMTPLTSHLVNDKSWIKGQCKKKLLDDCDRQSLIASAQNLHEALFAAASSYHKWFGDHLTIADAYEPVSAANEIFKEARRVITLISHLHVCQALRGEEQLTEASTLHQKQQTVPKPIRDCIAALHAKAEAAKSVRSIASPKRRRLTRSGE